MKTATEFQLPNFEFQECRIKEIVLNADLRNGHPGLVAIGKKHGASVDSLRQGEMIVYLNTKHTAFKALIAGRTALFHFREPNGHVIHRRAIATIPSWFNGGQASYSQELRKILEAELVR